MPALLGEPACERRGLDAAAVAVAPAVGRAAAGLLRLRSAVPSCPVPASRPRSRSSSRFGAIAGFSALSSAPSPPSTALFVSRLLLGRPIQRSLFALGADHGHGLPDLDLALLDEDLQEDARGVGLDLLGDLLGVELVERLALLDLVTLGLEPAHDRAGLHALAEARERDLLGHQAERSTVRLIAARTSALWGTTNSSITGANGSGVNFEPTRSTGASR